MIIAGLLILTDNRIVSKDNCTILKMTDFIFAVPEITIKPRVFKEISTIDNQLGGKKKYSQQV